jgi:hypothetical protein
MGSPDLQEFTAARPQNLYARRNSALCSLSVTHNVYSRSKHAALMFYSVTLTMAADAILFEIGMNTSTLTKFAA